MDQPDDISGRITRRRRARQIVAARLERLEDLSIGKLVPSTITLMALCSGVTAIRFGLREQWTTAVTFVIAAMILDMLDGRAARMLGADSRFGAQLDSLADLVSFGVAPAVIMYMWTLQKMGNAGWIAALIFCACAAIRLARFNVESVRDEGATKGNPYFTGLPTPAAACMMLLPLLISFQWNDSVASEPWVSGVFIAITSVLMVSRMPDAVHQIYEAAAPAPLSGGRGLCGPGGAADRLALGDLDGRPVDLCRVHSVRDVRASSALRDQTGYPDAMHATRHAAR